SDSRPTMRLRILRWLAQRTTTAKDDWMSLAVEYEGRKEWDAARSAWHRWCRVDRRSMDAQARAAYLRKLLDERWKHVSDPGPFTPPVPELKLPLARGWHLPLQGETMLALERSPAVDAEYFFFFGGERKLTCRSVQGGSHVWTRPLDHEARWTARHGDLVVV